MLARGELRMIGATTLDEYRQYIVMEYVKGRTLKQIVRQHNQEERLMPVKRILDLTIQVCSGIGYAHRAHLVHCDVKPQNVLVTRDERIKVADFGIARASHKALETQAEVMGIDPADGEDFDAVAEGASEAEAEAEVVEAEDEAIAEPVPA